MPEISKPIVVVGGGAAGFFCAVNVARMLPDIQVILLEKTGKLLSKVKVSGGGRCNVTQSCFDITEMASRYPRGRNFVKKTFHHFFTTDTIEWFKQRGVVLKTEADGRMFPVSNNSETIIRCLLDEASRYNVDVRTNTVVTAVKKTSDFFQLTLGEGTFLDASRICLTTGGYPKKEQFDWITTTGHQIIPPVPSLFTFNVPGHPIRELMGVSVNDARIKIPETKLTENGPLLITHWGLSGPAILRLSAKAARELHEMNYHFSIRIHWLPEYDDEQLRLFLQDYRNQNGGSQVFTKNPFGLPQRLWQFLVSDSGIGSTIRWSELLAKQQNQLFINLSAYPLDVKGKTTFKEEFVTAGGVTLSEIDPSTMESRKMAGLYFAGEVMDVDGITGGYNFQQAWTSGWIAATSIARSF